MDTKKGLTNEAGTDGMNSFIPYKDQTGYSLSDRFMRRGETLEGFIQTVDHISDATKVYTVKAKDLVIGSYMRASAVKGIPCYEFMDLSGRVLEHFERTGQLCQVAGEDGRPERVNPLRLSLRGDNTALLTEEAKNAHVHLFASPGARKNENFPIHLYISEEALAQLLTRAGLTGDAPTGHKTLARDVALASFLADTAGDVQLVTREIVTENGYVLQKVFGVLTGKYKYVDSKVLYKAIEMLTENAELGTVSVKMWETTQSFSEIRVEFPDAADDYAAAYGLPARIVPGIRLCTSDTGASSVVVEPTYRINDGFAIGDEGVRQVHRGDDLSVESILSDVSTLVLSKMQGFPEAMVDRMAVQIGTDDLSTSEGRRRNKQLIMRCIRAGFRHLKINEILGKIRRKVVLEKLDREIDGSVRYTEFDIALLFMGLAERCHIDSREVRIRLAKACGKAANISVTELLNADAEPEIDIYVEDAEAV